jgi:hypothetical protein
MTKRIVATIVAATILSLTLAEAASARWAYRIVNRNSGLVLMPAGGSTAWGTPLFQRAATGSTAQHWFLNYEGDGRYSFENRRSHLCIHPSSWSPIRGAYLNQASCTTTNGARMWFLLPPTGSDGYTFRIQSAKNWMFMDVEGSSRLMNALAVQERADSSASQLWRLQPVGDV